ncbi:hypothetical protein C7S18_16750 [Ahniella affigens]|uniref:Uncharacterized protein n=1 Tax=Ahniella affigens TaxID=2021234 RepID=A0A2P1PV57_9GAMM|nr:hypothetical protein [Ahniella affigens]AVP98736.1 hypothetical protein C7S18_16750 [Ahniella affigens]
MKRKLLAVLCLYLCAQASALAWMQTSDDAGAKANPVRHYEAVIADIRVNLEPGGKYAYVPQNDRPAVEEQLGIISSILAKVDSIDELNQRRKIRLFNAQEKLNGLLLQSEDNREHCQATKLTGTHMTKTVCLTNKQREEAEETRRRFTNSYVHGFGSPNG